MSCVLLEGITKEYAGRRVLDIPRLEIGTGEVCALLGPNGAGKTTLLNILALLDRPTAGMISYGEGASSLSEKDRQLIRRQVVMVDQHPVMFSTTVFANMEFGLKVRKVGGAMRKRRILEALELVGMSGFASAPAHRLSGGEIQRIAMARALALSPRVLLCDEPTSNVDVENQAVIFNLLRQVNAEQGVTIIFTSHDRTQGEHLAHRLITLDRGKIIGNGHENIFTAELIPGDGTPGRCLLYSGLSLEAPTVPAASRGGSIRISIDPSRIHFNGGAFGKQGESVLDGRVRQVTEVNGSVRIIVDGGLWFTVVVASEEYRQKPVPVGETVTLHIPSEAIRFLS